MTKKRIRQMNGALRRRLTNRPAADWLPDGESFARTLEAENYMQRFAPLFRGVRLHCAEVLALCHPELDALSGGQEPAQGWLAYTYDFACRLLYPEEDADTSCAAGGVTGTWNYENRDLSGNAVVLSILMGQTELYRSESIAPGERIEEIRLSQPLSAGTYEAVAVTAIYDADGNYLFANRIPVTLDVAK